MHFITSGKGVFISRSTISSLEVMTSSAVSSPKRIMPFSILLSSDISFLSVSSKACDSSSTERLGTLRFLVSLFIKKGGMYQQIRHGLKNRTQQINNRCCFTAKFQRILCRIYFRHDFPEKQQQKSKHNRYKQKLKQLSIAKIYHAGKKGNCTT